MRPGYRIGNYVIIEQIGQGGQAAVWSADDEALKRLVAVKTISLAAAASPGDISPEVQAERFQFEARLIADLEHPYILPIYSFGQEGDELYLIMRYMAGGTLKKMLQQKPLDLARAIAVAKPLADALDVAHQKNIVHRDIKSVNILMDGRQNAYLADFGLSVTAGTIDTSGVQSSGAGTLAYMSPEQMRSEPPEPRSDIYAFGILLFEMLTGNVPLIKNQPWNLQQLMSGVPLPVPDTIPLAVANVLRRATASDPNDRYRTALEMVEDLSEAATARQREAASPDTIEITDSEDVILFQEEGEVAKPSGPLPVTDPAMLALIKANGMFETALNDWADGAGRFRLYAEDFAYIDSFYSASDSWGVNLDDAAKRMMLRAALEHGHNVDTWWSKLTDIADRRAVTLQTLTSELPPARLRAMQHLTDIQDSTPPAIPIRVANIIKKEPDAAVRLAGVKLLEARADRARTGDNSSWRQVAYSDMIDSVLADLAANDPDPNVAEAAARASARLHSTYAITRLGQQAAQDNLRAREALVNARDEVSAFPSSVPGAIRRRVFALLSIRQFFGPGLVARYVGGTLGFAVGWALLTYVGYMQIAGSDLLSSQAVGNALASGIMYGALMGFGLVASTEPARRLRVWSIPGRIILGAVLGMILIAGAFLALRRYYYFSTEDIDWWWLLLPSLAMSAGFAIPSDLTGNTFLRALGGSIGSLAALWIVYQAYVDGRIADPLVNFQLEPPYLPFAFAVLMALSLGILTFSPELLRLVRGVARRIL